MIKYKENKPIHKHTCPICNESYQCFGVGKHDEQNVVCMDEKESYCNECQNKHMDEIEEQLKKEGRL